MYLSSKLLEERDRTLHMVGSKPLEGEHHLHQHTQHQHQNLVAQVQEQTARGHLIIRGVNKR